VQSKLKDTGRMWLWGFLAVIALAQLYVVRELLAAFVIFALGFAALAFVVVSLYMLQKSWELAMARISAYRRPVISMANVTTKMASVANLGTVGRENHKAA
jgi:FtsH-binding integral membrane protein